ncbi:MAG: metabolite traffic protein EboE [Planctomycetia bacterium]
MAFSPLPPAYCTNVHPCRAPVDVPLMLDRHVLAVRDHCGFAISVGLWLPEAAVAAPGAAATVAEALAARGLSCHTLNAFPFGDFHGARVKEQVYLPDWADPRRLDYTLACARLLAALLPPGGEGSISTLPLGFKGFEHGADFTAAASDALLACARQLAAVEADTGRCIRLAIEPEPCCLLETTPETVAFFAALFARAAALGIEPAARRHLGVCYDVCHQAVEFEDAAEAVAAIAAAGIRINKVQVSCAIEVPDPADPAQREAIAAYVEPRYLHQTFARDARGDLHHAVDLTADLLADAAWHTRAPWRVHYHVPVDADRLGPLRTTRGELARALTAIGGLDYAPHLEVETYTWPVLPGADATDLATGIARELIATRALIETVG